MAKLQSKLALDSLKSIRLWRVWLYLGTQDLKARFKRSFIGPLWILLNMCFFVGGAGVVYGMLFGQPMREFLPFLTAGFIIWGLITSSVTEASQAFVSAEGYIKQFAFPKQIYLLRQAVVYVNIFLIGICALIPLQLIFGTFSLVGWALAIPGFVCLLIAAQAHTVVFAYLGARFRDLPHAMTGILQVLFFVTPIMFPVEILRQRNLDFIYQYNPLYYLIDIVRHPILEGQFARGENYFFAVTYTLLAWVVAAIVARRCDDKLVFWL